MKFYPPLLVLICLIGQIILAFRGPLQPLIAPHWQYLGVGLMFAAFLTMMLIARKFSRRQTTIIPDGKPSELMEDGLFAYSRNPIYVAMTVLLLGSGLAVGQVWGLLVVPIFILLVQRMWIVKEEENLEEEFGQMYRNYKAKVRRWV